MLGCVQLNAQQDAFCLNYKRTLRSDRISEAVTIPIIRGILKFYTGAPTMLVEEYKRLGSVFSVKVLTDNVSFLFSPGVSSYFFKAEEADMSQKEL